MRRDTAAEFARAVAFEDAIRDRLSDDTETFRWGTALFTSAIPEIYDANFLRVEKADDEIDAGALIAEADRLMEPRGLAHRKVVVSDEVLGEKLAPDFREQRWNVDRLLFMVHRRPPERGSPVDVDEIVAELHVRAKETFNREQLPDQSEEAIRQMNDMARMLSGVTDKRAFAAYVDGTIASVCELYSDGITAQIEDVNTLSEHRSKGLATAVVLRALHEAQSWGHEMVFLVADDEDWPKGLYGQLGFDPIGRTYQFLLKPQP